MAKKSKAVKHLIIQGDEYENSPSWAGWIRECGPLTEAQCSRAATAMWNGEPVPYGILWPMRARWTFCGLRLTENKGTVRIAKATCAMCLVEWDRRESFK